MAGKLPVQLSDREAELWTTRVEVVTPPDSRSGVAAQQIYKVLHDLNENKTFHRHVIQLPEDILNNPEYKFTINHELAHCLEGHGADIHRNGLARLFPSSNRLSTGIDEGMTEHIAEIFSGQKPNYTDYEENGIVGTYHVYYDFIDFLSSSGKTKIDIRYFIDAYVLNDEDGDKAIATLRDKIAEAFPTQDGSHPLDNLASHSEAQIEYWLAKYTGHDKTAETILNIINQ